MTNHAWRNMGTALTVLTAAALLAGACGCEKKEKKTKIGFCMTLDHPYWQNMRLGAIDEAKKLGVEVTIMNAEEDATKQIKQIKELIARGVDVLCVGIREANRKNIPVIIVNREISKGCDYVCYTGTSTYDGAVTSAKILMDAIGHEGGIIEFHQHLGSGPQIARSKALKDVMSLPENSKVKCIARIFHGGKRALTTKEMQTLLSDPERAKRIKGVYAHGDNFAIAAAKACVQAGRKDIAVVGMGGSQEAIDAIKKGLITGTSFQRPEEEGRSAVRLAVKHLKKEKLKKRYMIPCPAITKENAHKFKGQF